MHYRTTFRSIAVALGIFAMWGINTIAMKYSLYLIIPWFDNFMHFSGGLWVAFAIIVFVLPKYPATRTMFFVLAGVLIVGIGWELFEFVLGKVTYISFGDMRDTFTDLLFDLLGGALAFMLYFAHGIGKKTETNILRRDG